VGLDGKAEKQNQGLNSSTFQIIGTRTNGKRKSEFQIVFVISLDNYFIS